MANTISNTAFKDMVAHLPPQTSSSASSERKPVDLRELCILLRYRFDASATPDAPSSTQWTIEVPSARALHKYSQTMDFLIDAFNDGASINMSRVGPFMRPPSSQPTPSDVGEQDLEVGVDVYKTLEELGILEIVRADIEKKLKEEGSRKGSAEADKGQDEDTIDVTDGQGEASPQNKNEDLTKAKEESAIKANDIPILEVPRWEIIVIIMMALLILLAFILATVLYLVFKIGTLAGNMEGSQHTTS